MSSPSPTGGLRIGPLDAEEAVDLAHALAVRGMVGAPRRLRHAWVVVVSDSHEDPERLRYELVDALAEWLADRGREAVEVRGGGRRAAVAAHAALRTA